MRLVIIKQQPWAVGLQWFMGGLKSPRATLIKQAQSVDTSWDILTFRQRQHGFGSSNGAPATWTKVRALAPALRITSASFLGLFQLDDVHGEKFWWVCAISQSVIMGDGDQLFQSREEAQSFIRSLRGLLDEDFAESITCESFEKSCAWLEPMLHIGFLQRWNPNYYLQPLELEQKKGKHQRAFRIAAIMAAIMGICIGAKMILSYQEEQNNYASQRAALQAQMQQKQKLLAHPENHFNAAWTKAPLANGVAAACIPAILAIPVMANGWAFDEAKCNGQSITVTWEFRPGADYLNLPESAKLETPQKALAPACPLAALPPQTQRMDRDYHLLLSREKATRHLYQITQISRLKLKLTFAKPETRTVDKVELTAPWAVGKWELKELPASIVMQGTLAQMLAELPGLTLTTVLFSKNIWTFQGAIYAKAQ